MNIKMFDAWLPDHPLALAALGLGALLLLAWVMQWLAHFILLRVVGRAVDHVGHLSKAGLAPLLFSRPVLRRMAQVVPVLVVQVGVRFVPHLPPSSRTWRRPWWCCAWPAC